MGKQDVMAKEYLRDAEVFADVFNHYLYGGEKILNPQNLKDDNIELTAIWGSVKNVKEIQRYRDLLKVATVKTSDNAVHLLLGVEHQSQVNYIMPIRTMMYDSMQYYKQVSLYDSPRKRDRKILKHMKIKPVITLVLYLGAEDWDGPRSINEMLETGCEALEPYIADYKLNIIVPCEMSDEDLEQYDTDLGRVLKYIKYSTDAEKVDGAMNQDTGFRHMNWKAVRLLNEVTNSKIEYEEGEEVDMCKAIQDMRMKSREEGLEEGLEVGREEGREEGLEEGMQALIETLKAFLNTPEQIWTAIIKNTQYANVTLEDVMKYY